MLDQAYELREVVRGTHQALEHEQVGNLPVAIAITSGKGGVGKTNVVVNLAVSLANLQKRVLILDADFGLANIDVLLGMAPRYNLSDFVFGDKSLDDIVIEGPSGIKIIPASSGIEQMTALTTEQQTKLIRGISKLEAQSDYLLIDTAAGISANVIHLLLAAGIVIVVTAPEPTAIVDAYLVVKILAHRESHKRIYLVVNSVSGPGEARNAHRQIDLVARRFLNKPVELLGYIEKDKNMVESVRKQTPVVNLYPDSGASRCLKTLAKRIIRDLSPEQSDKRSSLSWQEFFGSGQVS
ncbi:MAG: MinD/ParA family protein [Acidobacteriota bacterium]